MSQAQTALSNFENSPYFWDLITLACLLVSVLGFLVFLVWLLGLPGRIAIARNHPDAEAVYTMGWVGFLAIVPWIQALIWAFKPTDKIDIRRLPDEERTAEREDLRHLVSYAYGKKAAEALQEAPLAGAAVSSSTGEATATAPGPNSAEDESAPVDSRTSAVEPGSDR